MYMGFRMGNGGDWRALFFVSLLTPWIAPLTIMCSAILGVIQVMIDTFRYGKEYSSAWMVSIAASFGIASLAYLFI
jgi:hypothetical protein